MTDRDRYELRIKYPTSIYSRLGPQGTLFESNNLDSVIQMMNYPSNYDILTIPMALGAWMYIYDNKLNKIIRPYVT